MFPTLLFGQFNNNTTSPYSRYGVGDLHGYSFGRSTAMGGAALASRYEQQINLANPASYNAIDTLGFMFEFGINGRFSEYSNDLGSYEASDVNFQYFAMNFHVSNRFGAVLGLVPFSDVGYNVVVSEEVPNSGAIRTNYYGVGTLSKAFMGLAVEPFKNLSLGANFSYTFGLLNRNTEVAFLDAADFYQIQQYKSIRLTDFGVDFGAQYTIPLKDKKKIILAGVIQKPKYRALNSDITLKNITVGNQTVGYSTDQDTLNYLQETKGTVEYPLAFGLGFSYVKENSLEINADYYRQGWGEAKFFGDKSDYLTDLNKFALGAEWIPDKFSIRSYTQRVAYRVGFSYEQTYLTFDKNQINDFGISFGVGLPVYRSKSTINLAAQFGKRGTKENNLVLENYFRFNASVNLYDLWFIKRRFD